MSNFFFSRLSNVDEIHMLALVVSNPICKFVMWFRALFDLTLTVFCNVGREYHALGRSSKKLQGKSVECNDKGDCYLRMEKSQLSLLSSL